LLLSEIIFIWGSTEKVTGVRRCQGQKEGEINFREGRYTHSRSEVKFGSDILVVYLKIADTTASRGGYISSTWRRILDLDEQEGLPKYRRAQPLNAPPPQPLSTGILGGVRPYNEYTSFLLVTHQGPNSQTILRYILR